MAQMNNPNAIDRIVINVVTANLVNVNLLLRMFLKHPTNINVMNTAKSKA
jgi:hypothetical protein